jgi:hypothetical protein
MVSDRFDRRNYLPPWPRVAPAVVAPVAGLMTGHAYIHRFINTTWSPPCASSPQ